uniref:Putative phosphoglycerate mutase n=1 Tax=Tetraselmis sp. GSL018 TaxID=582737 RepID=A0A061QWF0_9CHLO
MSQAETTQKLLENDNFDVLFHSPLERASRTAEIVWGDREGPVVVLPSLREIDLYSFQGLLKDEGMARYGEQFKAWQKHASKFEIDGHAPVRELWYRGSLVWREVLRLPTPYSTALVVAHNAVNQAILCTALGLPPTYFRRILQSNGATSVLDLSPGSPPRVTVDRLNQSPGSPLLAGAGRKTAARIVLVRHAATFSTEDGLMLGTMDEECSPLGEVHSQKIGELLMDSEVGRLFSSPLARARTTAAVVTKYQKLAGNREPRIETMEELLPPDAGDFTGMRLRDIRDRGGLESPPEEMEAFWQRTREAWAALLRAADGNGGQPVVAVAHASVIAALLCHCLDLPENKLSIFRTDPGGITIIDFPDGAEDGRGVIRCSNYTSHLGRWAVPITPDSLDLVCGVDGCF